MIEPFIVKTQSWEKVDPFSFFGRDAQALLEACKTVYENQHGNGRYKECYRSPFRPTFEEIRKNYPGVRGFELIRLRKKIVAEWEDGNPCELAKEKHSYQEWQRFMDKQFRIIYGIAKRHHLHIDWHGKDSVVCCPDLWTIFKNHRDVARIHCS